MTMQQLQEEIQELQEDIQKTHTELQEFKRRPRIEDYSLPLCLLKEGHSGPCQFE